ncbi:hypothetical protein GGQ80_002077 [Sphingomonas jinjuensis]|uniref:Uncharacterized protein n=1 Tax=Sphingomonas jinjuensis TaxID=535907 RepID=A0A840FEW2_9SPHN|nr:hypothetical protein [Sphingomonas jinjuensis]MBB4154167.1 hypothetical protein [Sphingomonas jinjuensis]
MADAGITFAIASDRVAQYLAAETAVLAGQSTRFADGRELTRADLREIREGLAYWQAHVDRLNPNPPAMPLRRAVGRVRPGRYRMR